MTRRGRAVPAACAALLVGGLAAGVLSAAPARADVNAVFDGTANAYGVDSTVSNGAIPLIPDVEGAGPVASGHLSSLGISDGFASFPYPGDVAASLPGAAGALTGLPVPAYPLIAATGEGEDPQTVGYGAFTLTSSSSLYEVDAAAVVGSTASGNSSTARVQLQSDGSLESVAESTLNAVSLGALGVLHGVRSYAKVVADPDTGTITRTTDLSIGELDATGVSLTIPTALPSPPGLPGVPTLPSPPPVTIPDGGQTITGPDIGFENGSFTVSIPIPGQKAEVVPIPASTVIAAFKAVGIGMTYQAPDNSATGVVAPALTFTYTADLPANSSGVQGPTPVTLTVGRSTATADLHPIQVGLGTTSSLPIDSGGLSGASGTIAGTTTTTGSTGSTGAITSSSPLPGLSAPEVAAPQVAGGAGQQRLVASIRTPVGDVSLLYLVVVGVGLIGLLASAGMRFLGVRSLWSS